MGAPGDARLSPQRTSPHLPSPPPASLSPPLLPAPPAPHPAPRSAFYSSILNTNCEAVIGYVPLPVGVVGPLMLDGESLSLQRGGAHTTPPVSLAPLSLAREARRRRNL